MNIAQKMHDLIETLKSGENLEGIKFPDITPECEDMWHEHYAIVKGFYWDFGIDGTPPYFDEGLFLYEMKQVVLNTFKGDDPVAICRDISTENDIKDISNGTVIINFYLSSQELEVYRKGRTQEHFDEVEDLI